MNELLKDKLKAASNDEILIMALRELFMEEINKAWPKIIGAEDDELLGQRFRAYETAQTIIDDVFKEIKSMSANKKQIKSFNKER